MVEPTGGLTEAQAALETEMNRLADEYLPDQYGYGADANIEGLTNNTIRVHSIDEENLDELATEAAEALDRDVTFSVGAVSEADSVYEVTDIQFA